MRLRHFSIALSVNSDIAIHMKYAVLLMLSASLLAANVSAQTPSTPPQTQTPPDASSLAAVPAAERKAHEELIAFRAAIQAAFNKMGESGKAEDMAPLLDLVHPECLLTAMNGETVRGKKGIMDYFNRHMVAEGHSIARIQDEFAADELSIFLSPDIAINRGISTGTYKFTNGSEIVVKCRWTATLTRYNGNWTVAAFQFGPSIFDNPVVDALKGWIYKGAGIAGVAALLVGWLIGRKSRRSGVAQPA